MRLTSGSIHSLSSLLLLAASVTAISFPIHARRRDSESLARRHSLRRRGEPDGSFGNGSTSLADAQDTLYTCNILLGGKGFEVQIDTGRRCRSMSPRGCTRDQKLEYPGISDIWIRRCQRYVVPELAYINVDDAEGLEGLDGIIGLGPSSASDVRALLNSSAGDPPLDRIFRQNTTTPNFLTVLLARSTSTESSNSSNPFLEQEPDQLTIGEIVSGYEAILNATHLPALVDQFGNQHWQTLLDSNGIIGPDGARINTTTAIKNPTAGAEDQLHVVFDTGFSLPQLPKYVADAIYGVVPGAEFVANGSDYAPQSDLFSSLVNFYVVPCTYELNVSFVFAGTEFPIAPLDLVLNATSLDPSAVNSNGSEICIASYQEVLPNIEGNPSFGALDAIFGMAFLRNVYILINFGDFVDGSPDSVADPYIQLLSTVDRSAAHLDFVNARLGGVDTTGSQPALLPRPSNSTSTSSSTSASSPSSSASTTSSSSSSTTTTAASTTSAVSSSSVTSSSTPMTTSGADKNLDIDTASALSDSDSSDSSSKPFYQQTAFIVGISVAGGVVLLLLAFGIFRAFRTRRSKVRGEAAFVPQMGSYKPLVNDGAPISYTDTAYRPPYEARRYGDVDEA